MLRTIATGFALLLFLAGASLTPADAQDIGYIAFRKALTDLGYIVGRNAILDERFAEAKLEWLPAMAADLVILDANPLDDIAHTKAIRAVIVRGRCLDRAALDKMLADTAASVARSSAITSARSWPAAWSGTRTALSAKAFAGSRSRRRGFS